MRRVLPIIFGIVACLLLTGLVAYGSPERQAYRAAKGNIKHQVQSSQERVHVAVEMATRAVLPTPPAFAVKLFDCREPSYM